jgi:Na+/H+ antiporter NhaD/arsenite permease-like protein
MFPIAVAGLLVEYAVLSLGFRKVLKDASIHRPEAAPSKMDRPLLIVTAIGLSLAFMGFVAGLNLSWTALGGSVLVMVLARRDTHAVLKLVDWHLLVFFAALFIVVEGLNGTGLPDQIFSHVRGVLGTSTPSQVWNFTWFSALGSNVFSNVPFVLVAGKWIGNFAQPELMWKVMAMATTLAGNLTIVGSVANIIVLESARGRVQVSFWDYARFGIPVTVLTLTIGVVLLLIMH